MNATTIQTDDKESSRWTPRGLGLMPSTGGQQLGIKAANFAPMPTQSKDANASKNHLVEALVHAPVFREYQRAFEDATGLPLTLRAVAGWQLAHNDSRQQNGFCALMSKTSRSCAACLQMQQRVCEGVNGVPCTMSCTFGLSETAVGVKIGQDIIAYLQTGQVFFKRPTPQRTNRALKQIKEWGINLDMREAARRYNETPVVRRGEYQATVRLLQFFADQLGALANQISVQTANAEPPVITKAKQFIRDHLTEDLSLGRVSAAVHTSIFYFCKLFRKVTGLTFTDFVSRTRIENAKNLLLNPNFRVSEIAFEVGFQSLTHFNRVFKRIVGESPTLYRQHLATN